MIAYIALYLYFEHRLDKRIRQYEEKKNARSAKKRVR